MTDYEYEQRAAQEYWNRIREIEGAPLADRKEACAEFLEVMRNRPEIVGERVGWLIEGHYGRGEMQAAKRVLEMSARSNKVAILTQMIAALEWMCPGKMAISVWKKLTPEQKKALDAAVKREADISDAPPLKKTRHRY